MCFPVIQKTPSTGNPWDLMMPEDWDKKYAVKALLNVCYNLKKNTQCSQKAVKMKE